MDENACHPLCPLVKVAVDFYWWGAISESGGRALVQLLLITLLWFGWRGYREGFVQSLILSLLMVAAIPLTVVLTPVVSLFFPEGAAGPMRAGFCGFLAWVLGATVLHIAYRFLLLRHPSWKECLLRVSEKQWVKVGGIIVGCMEAFLVCVILAGMGRISARLYQWPDRFPGVAEFKQPGWLKGVSWVIQDPVGRWTSTLSLPFTETIDGFLQKMELLLELAARGGDIAELAKASPTLNLLIQDSRVMALLNDTTLRLKLEEGDWPVVWADPRVQEVWGDEVFWRSLEQGAEELRASDRQTAPKSNEPRSR